MTACRLKALLTSAIVAAVAIAAGAARAQEEKVLNIYNWSDYIAEDTLDNFERETGIKVNYDVYDSNEVLEAKLFAGNTGYDLVVPSSSNFARQIKAGIFQKLDKSKLTRYDNLDKDIMNRLQAVDPGNVYGVPYMWGTNGFGYNIQAIEARMPDAPVDSWDMLFNPDVVKNFADCGVSILDSHGEVVAIVQNYLGLDPLSKDPEDLKKVEAVLTSVRPYIKYFHSSQYIDDLANGEICVAMGFSGDIFQAIDAAAEAEADFEIAYVIPEEGTQIWFDIMGIPADAPHPENAHKFIDFVLQPEVVAAISNYVFYANPNVKATALVDPEVRDDPAIYPTPAVMEKLFPEDIIDQKTERARSRMWTRVKTGQ